MSSLDRLVIKARRSSFYRALLNLLLKRTIPFNRPHRLSIVELSPEKVAVQIPFVRSNQNHVGGLHACVMATAAEFASGLLMMQHAPVAEFRLIMKSLSMEYHYQGRAAAVAVCEGSTDWIFKNISEPLSTLDAVTVNAQSEVYDIDNNHLCTGTIQWHIKYWKAIKV